MELSLPTQWVDLVQKVRIRGKEYILHVEFQLHHQKELPRRLFVYSALLTEQFKLPVLTVVLYLERRKRKLPEAYQVRIGDQVIHQFTYRVIRLWELEEDIRLGKLRELAPLLILASREKDDAVLEQERWLILEEPDAGKRADLLALAMTIASRYFDKKRLWDFFREEVVQLRGSSLIEDWVEEGIQKGIQQGIQQGYIRALREDVVSLLEERFGVVEADILEALQKVDQVEALKTLHKNAVWVDSLEEFGRLLEGVLEHKT